MAVLLYLMINIIVSRMSEISFKAFVVKNNFMRDDELKLNDKQKKDKI